LRSPALSPPSTNLSTLGRNAHWIITALLTAAFLPLVHHFRQIPLSLRQIGSFWGESLPGSIIFAAVVYLLANPSKFRQVLGRTGPGVAFPKERLAALLMSSAYFVWAFVLVIYYNAMIAIERFDGRGDVVLERLDEMLCFGGSVPAMAHWFALHGGRLFWVVETVYVGLFSLVGACIIVVSLADGLRKGIRFAGAIATAYYISLIIFAILPTTGPYLLSPTQWPHGIILIFQREVVRELTTGRIMPTYYIGFPSMHVTQPLIAAWFLRKRPAFARIVLIYTAVMIPSIFLLEEHYVLDVIAAFPLAALSIWIVEGFPLLVTRSSSVGFSVPLEQDL
jgi:hypothetical protein